LQLYVWGLYKKFPTGAWGKSFAKVRNFDLQKTLGGSNICIGAFVCSSRNSISVSLYRDGIVFSYLIGYTNCV
jgi:hypothetical protein